MNVWPQPCTSLTWDRGGSLPISWLIGFIIILNQASIFIFDWISLAWRKLHGCSGKSSAQASALEAAPSIYNGSAEIIPQNPLMLRLFSDLKCRSRIPQAVRQPSVSLEWQSWLYSRHITSPLKKYLGVRGWEVNRGVGILAPPLVCSCYGEHPDC